VDTRDVATEQRGQEEVLSVSTLTRQIKRLLEQRHQSVWVEGELSNVKHHSSGHLYFSLVDEGAQLRCVMFRQDALSLRFAPDNGIKVRVWGRIGVYEKGGLYQLYTWKLMPAGVGELALALERLKARLQAEGLFERERKRRLPPFPERIGIVTAPTGAAIRDILHVIRRRYPPVELVVRPVRVQGEGASDEIAQALVELNEYGKVDLIIVTRGGGSMEDLWAFNEEKVARAIASSLIPVVSAVGHEIDFTIADLVADLRAPTPSAAAELVVPDREELLARVELLLQRARDAVERSILSARNRLEWTTQRYGFRYPEVRVLEQVQQVDELVRRMEGASMTSLNQVTSGLDQLTSRLEGLSPLGILARGYCLCHTIPGRKLVKEARQVQPSDEVEVTFHRGQARCTVISTDGG
jgi:exodeoxyribonuclease VII large subunit